MFRARLARIGGCVLFDTAKLRTTGGFDFWRDLPLDHRDEDALAQLRVVERFGACHLFPSAFHMALPNTLTEPEVDPLQARHRRTREQER